MTRNEVKDLLIGAGVAEPTEDAISAFLNKHNTEIQKEKALADKYKSDATRVSDLEAQLEELNNKGLSEAEMAKKETEKANTKVADLEKQIALMQRKASLAEIGIVGEDADKLFGADGSLDTSVLGAIISARETSAKSQMEKELLDRTPSPTGGNNNGNQMTDIEKMAQTVGKSIAQTVNVSTDVLSNYTK